MNRQLIGEYFYVRPENFRFIGIVIDLFAYCTTCERSFIQQQYQNNFIHSPI